MYSALGLSPSIAEQISRSLWCLQGLCGYTETGNSESLQVDCALWTQTQRHPVFCFRSSVNNILSYGSFSAMFSILLWVFGGEKMVLPPSNVHEVLICLIKKINGKLHGHELCRTIGHGLMLTIHSII